MEVSTPHPGYHDIDLSALDGIRGQPLLPGATDRKLPPGIARELTQPAHVWRLDSGCLHDIVNPGIRFVFGDVDGNRTATLQSSY